MPIKMGITKLFLVIISSLLLLRQSIAFDPNRKQSINTVLEAKWSLTPFALEISEFLSDTKDEYFWAYLEYLAEDDIVNRNMNEKQFYENLLEFTSRYLSVAQQNLLKFSLALKEHSPKIEMYQHLAGDRGVGQLNCEAVIEFRGKLMCEENFNVNSAAEGPEPKLFNIDHFHPHQEPSSPTAILYAELGSKSFQRIHRKLTKLASEGSIKYVFRHFLSNRPAQRSRLSGYGVELQIKSSEYKAGDDREIKANEGENEELGENEATEKDVKGFVFSTLVDKHPNDKEKLLELKQHLLDQSNNMAPLKVWELQDLSMQAAGQILSNSPSDQLNALEDLTQNFPSHARTLSRTKVPKDMKKEIKKNGDQFYANHGITPKDAMLFINGMQYDMDYVDIFTLLDVIKSENNILDGLGKLGLNEGNAAKMLSVDFSKKESEKFGVDIRNSAVHWINNIEKDKLYKGWPGSVQELLRPTFPGMLRSIRKNFFNVVLVCDPSKKESRDMIKTLESFYVHRAPTRIGLVFKITDDSSVTGEKDVGVALHNAFNYVSTEKDPAEALSFLTDVYSKVDEHEEVTLKIVKEVFLDSYGSDIKMDDVFGEDSEYDYGRQLAKDFIEKSGLNEPKINVLMNGIPFDESKLNPDEFEDELMMEIMRITQEFQRDVYKGLVTDNTDLLEYLMSKENILPSLNERIIKANTYIDLIGDTLPDFKMDSFAILDRASMASTLAQHMKYVSLKDSTTGQFNVLTCWVIADLETDRGREMFRGGITQIKDSPHMRLGIVHNIESKPGIVSRSIQAALETQSNKAAKTLISKILNPKTVKALEEGKKSIYDYDIPDADMDKLKERISELENDNTIFELQKVFVKSLPNFEAGKSRGVLLNGLVVGPLNKDEKFDSDDFHLLEKFAFSRYGEKLTSAFYNSMKVRSSTDNDLSDKAMKIAALLINRPESENKKSRQEIVYYSDKHSTIKLDPKYPDQPAFDIVAIMDPTTMGAQKVSSVLKVLQNVVNAKIKVFFNCVDKHSEMPQKSYFRMVLEPELQFNDEGSLSAGPQARFADFPKEPIFTMHHHIPDNWLIEPVKSLYDLDNIKLEKIEGNVNSEFELEHLLLEGHCFETGSGNPPRGLQLTLGTEQNPVEVDTIVMANLGYLQLKSNPGRWYLRLREGRSSEIYDISSHENTEGGENGEDIQVLITSFKSKIVKLKVSKKPDKRNEDLLGNDSKDSSDGGLWNSITSTITGSFGTKKEETKEGDDEDVLNIFCLASGHLYERLLKIMMLTTMRTTSAKKVKFWILKNYLSPSLKEVLPAFAKEYGFEFEYVQYKWPRWLNQQSQKQRIIWGYKILFLDVLFPLDVKKIIFVDTDQIVLSDLKELRDLDLEGAPYGYTPFCDSNKDMDGFRFWNSGYWKNHLAGRKYHISALYVIDLVKFRQIAAGDRLRGQYQALSQDPNSLANLDQDLPNNMIHQVPIKSLPQEWLWCETWCDQASKKKAKNIDLCNNPLTKESKLDAARRIVKEWTDYDEEIHKFIEKLQNNESNSDSSKVIESQKPHADAHTEL